MISTEQTDAGPAEKLAPILEEDAQPGKPHRLWVRSDPDYRSRLEQISKRIDRPMSQILRDGGEREMEQLLQTHPLLQGFHFAPLPSEVAAEARAEAAAEPEA